MPSEITLSRRQSDEVNEFNDKEDDEEYDDFDNDEVRGNVKKKKCHVLSDPKSCGSLSV